MARRKSVNKWKSRNPSIKMSNRWMRIGSGKYEITLDGWNFIVERIDDPDDLVYKFQLYENMERPQSASALELRIRGHNQTVKRHLNHKGADNHIIDFFSRTNALEYSGIPSPLKNNLIKALSDYSNQLKK